MVLIQVHSPNGWKLESIAKLVGAYSYLIILETIKSIAQMVEVGFL
jgi:hypothetical protein